MSQLRKQREDKLEERFSKSESLSERAMDELFFLKEQSKHLQDVHKKDIEETSEFIKQIISASKQDQQKEYQKQMVDLDRLHSKMSDKASLAELNQMQERMGAALDTKVDLREVQQALNECQGDIRD